MLAPSQSLGQIISDYVTRAVGSWRFIVTQSLFLLGWIVYNIIFKQSFDPYPFILLNLVLSFQAAFTAPIIMMSQNRQSDIDRKKMESDYHINIKAEKEIALLHQKIDLMKEQEIKLLIQTFEKLEKRLNLDKS